MALDQLRKVQRKEDILITWMLRSEGNSLHGISIKILPGRICQKHDSKSKKPLPTSSVPLQDVVTTGNVIHTFLNWNQETRTL